MNQRSKSRAAPCEHIRRTGAGQSTAAPDYSGLILAPDVKERLPTLGFEAVASTPEEFASRIKVETEMWGKVIRAANIKPE